MLFYRTFGGPVTWYKITHAGTRVAQWGRVKVDWNELLWKFHCAFCVLYHVIAGSCKGLLIGRSSTLHTSVLHLPPPSPSLKPLLHF